MNQKLPGVAPGARPPPPPVQASSAVRDLSVHDELCAFAMRLEREHGLRLEAVTFRWRVHSTLNTAEPNRTLATLVGAEVVSSKGGQVEVRPPAASAGVRRSV